MLLWFRLLPLLLLMTAADSSSGSGNGDSGTQESTSDTDSGSDAVDADDSDADDNDDADPDGDGASGSGRVQGTTFERGFNNLLERFGNNARRVAEHLYRQDYKHRENLRLARGEAEQLRQKLPKDGNRVIDRNTARELETYRKLGKPSDLQSKLTAGEQAASKLKTREKDDIIRDVAEVTGWNYKALRGAAADLDYTVKEVEENGKKSRKAFVVTRNGENATETEAPEWFQANKDFLMPSLTANGSGGSGGATGGYGQQFIVQPVTQQRSNGSQQPQSAASAILARYDEPKAK